MDSVLTWLRTTFRTGIVNMPAYKLGDQVSMALDTRAELDNLPTTDESEEDKQ